MSGPQKSESPGGAGLFANHRSTNESPDCRGEMAEAQAEGGRFASALLRRMLVGSYRPGELATLLAFLNGPLLPGACAVLEQALAGRLLHG